MAFSTITVTHTFLNPDNTPASGQCVFQLTKRMTNGTQSVMPGVSVVAPLNGSGAISASLFANTDTGTAPGDAEWMVDIRINNKDDGPYFFTLPNSPTSQDLGTLLNAAGQTYGTG